NRSIDRAYELARMVGGRVVPFDEWPAQCREIDILITSTSSKTPLLRPENLGPMLRGRLDRPLFIIDIAQEAFSWTGKSWADAARSIGPAAFYHRHRRPARCRSQRKRVGRCLSL